MDRENQYFSGDRAGPPGAEQRPRSLDLELCLEAANKSKGGK